MPRSADLKLPSVGDELAGKYRLERELGRGGMGVVFEALHIRLKQRVAIKMLLPDVLEVPELVARFEREARAAAALKGPNAARVLDVSETSGGIPFLVMEFLEGHDLSAELEARGSLPIPEACDLVLQATSAIVEAHDAGIIHRDLKPSNLFLAREREGRVVKLLDFGISKLTNDDGNRVTQTRATFGTPLYMSPEQVRSSKNVDPRTDVWSLGVILFEVLAGQAPFEGAAAQVGAAIVADPTPSLRALRPEVPAELEAIVSRALEKSPDKRFQTARDFADALQPFAGPSSSRMTIEPASRQSVNEEPATIARSALAPRPEGATTPGWTTARRARRAGRASFLAGLAVALVLGAALLFKLVRDDRAHQAPAMGIAPPNETATTRGLEPSVAPSATADARTTLDAARSATPATTAAPSSSAPVPIATPGDRIKPPRAPNGQTSSPPATPAPPATAQSQPPAPQSGLPNRL